MGTSKLWGDGGGGTCDGLTFHPGGAATTSLALEHLTPFIHSQQRSQHFSLHGEKSVVGLRLRVTAFTLRFTSQRSCGLNG